MKQLRVAEIFCSLQGEGANAGRQAVFIRLAGCNLSCDFCDTRWDSAKEMTVEQIMETVLGYNTRFIIWTGGEPTLQLDDKITGYFRMFEQAIETNGAAQIPAFIDYVSYSPKKVSPHGWGINSEIAMGAGAEYRFAIGPDDKPPRIESLKEADHYFLSPIFTGPDKDQLDKNALDNCLKIIKGDPRWRLSIQTHKLLSIP